MSLRPCSVEYCLGAIDEILAFCENHRWPINDPIVLQDYWGPCFINCPFISSGIRLLTSLTESSQVEIIEKMESVMVCDTDLEFHSETVIRSQASSGMEYLLYTVLIQFNNTALVVTGDHIFMLSSGKLITADRLTKEHLLMSSTGESTKIDAVHVGAYKARFHHISTALSQDSENAYRFINTNGVISGDYLMLFYLYNNRLNNLLIQGYHDLPIVGSHDYLAKYGDECLRPPVGNTDFVTIVDKMPDENAGHFFLPVDSSRIDVPANAHCLLPPAEAIAKLGDPARLVSDRVSESETRKLIKAFESAFPDIQFHLCWIKSTPNACTWKDNNQRHVLIYGGLARNLAIENEGLSLFISHEVGHHHGTGPISPHSGLYCEGQADFNAIGHMRTMYSLGANATITKAIQQAANFFGVSNSPIPPAGAANCTHPAKPCRIATYHAGQHMQSIPACAT